MTIDDAIQEYLGAKQNRLTHDTYVWYSRFLKQFSDWTTEQGVVEMGAVTPSLVQQFVSATPSGNSNSRHHRAQVVKGWLNWCSKDEDMGVKIRTVSRIEMPKQEQGEVVLFTPANIQALIHACGKMRYPFRNRAIIHLLLDTGIRASELCFDGEREEEETGLRIDNVILGTGKGRESYIGVMGKGRKYRTIGIGDATRLALKSYMIRERPRVDSPYVFLAQGTAPLSVRMLEQFLGVLGSRANVPDCHPHRFRHTFAVNQLLNGTPDLILMQLLGHATLESTKIYTRAVSQQQARKAASSVVDRMNLGKSRHFS